MYSGPTCHPSLLQTSQRLPDGHGRLGSVGPLLALTHCQPPSSPKATDYSLVPKCPLATGDLSTHLIRSGSLQPTRENLSDSSSDQVAETEDEIFDSGSTQTLSKIVDQFLQWGELDGGELEIDIPVAPLPPEATINTSVSARKWRFTVF